jgi:hypothetical protein
LALRGLGRTRTREFHFAEYLIVVIDESNIYFYGLAHTGIRKMLFDSRTVRFVRELLADLREIVLTSGMLNVSQQFCSFPHPVTAAPE